MNITNPSPTVLLLCLWLLPAPLVMGDGSKINFSRTLEAGDVFPGKSYDATFTGDGFKIQSKDKAHTYQVQSLPPVYQAEWTADSQTLCTVEHLAGGSNPACFHFDAERGTWFRMNLKPPGGPYKSYRVSQWNVGEKEVSITYSAQPLDAGAAPKNVPLTVAAPLFAAFSESLKPQAQISSKFLAFTLFNTNPARLPLALPPRGGPISRSGTVAIDTDGTTNNHHDPIPPHQNICSAMMDANGKLIPRRTKHGQLPAGCKDVSADNTSYAVAPSDLAQANKGTLKIGDKIEITLAGKTHTTVLADFGPVGGNGEVSCHEIYEIGCTIRDRPAGPIPLYNGSDANIPVTVVYYP